MPHALLVALLLSAPPKIGDIAPNFSVYDTNGVHLELSRLVKTGPVILAFFPKAFTSG